MRLLYRSALSKVFVEEAVRLLVTRFIPLSSEDVSKWYEDPEDWANAEAVENDQWEFEPRVRDSFDCIGTNT
jgi:hypothetical protein